MSKESNFKAAEEWLEKSKENKCIGFIAFAVNENDDCCFAANCESKQLAIMLINGCDGNPFFKSILIALAKHYEEQEGGEK